MLQRFFTNPFLVLILGSLCLSASSGYQTSEKPSIQGIKPGVSDDSTPRDNDDDRGTGREEIALSDSDSAPSSRDGNFRMGDWDYRGNWRYNREAFYRGETQPQAYREEHPYGPSGIGYDADVNYSRNLKRYQEIYRKHPTAQNKERLEHYINPYHVDHYQGNYGEGSYYDPYKNSNSVYYYDNQSQQYSGNPGQYYYQAQ